ncbi:hypothetical protein BO71DRAFT_447956 [Aspergillus ellipticus CBS 707.79]|uniref:Rad2-like endonuclease n=1 Tax=Aspergillus ellipticus CBS 707.79 TaxID=1448320 RepID=A0A319DJ16_9EURO|nr:hypothetical protein BO71DRAFT_447956 [Aspergillus ellipticus CBS 707.79]
MGIPGLIHAIGAGERISLSKLAITHLERTQRPIRIAVDISIWLFQVQAGRGGRNPELRTLFYRLLKILALPIHPLFVYDGKNKPPFKRGKAVSGRSYGSAPIIRLSKILVDLFRFPRHEAPGEAEAECAKLQRTGVVDAVMSNDVDALMFGSTLTVMNFSKENGTSNAAATHVTCYSMGSSPGPSRVMLDRAGMILFAMLSGGDYLPSGVPKCGSKLAGEIAKAGFGADLLEILDSEGDDLDKKLAEWRERLQYELEENESGYFQTKHKVVRVPEAFPDRTLLSYYAKPVVSTTSDIEALQGRLVNAWDKEIDVTELRRFTADSFEWNYRSGARKMTRLLAEPLISYRLRLGRQASAFHEDFPRLSNSNVPMLQKVYKSRANYSTDGLTEYQVDMVPVDVVGLDILSEEPNPPLPSQESTMSGDEDEEGPENNAEPVLQSPTKKRVTKRYDPYASEKLWVFETLATIGIPEVVANWKKEQAEKLAPKKSAPKKPAARKTGPKKKGPIDPAMKRGSILKYGTVTKERSEISTHKSAQLLEAVSGKSPAKLSLSSSPSNLSLQQRPSIDQCNDLPGLDDLVDQFSSLCHETPSINLKRQPKFDEHRITGRRGSAPPNGADVEALGLSKVEGSSSPQPSSNSRKTRTRLKSDRATDGTKHADAPKPPQKSQPRLQNSSEVEDLEQAISSIALDDTTSKTRKKPALLVKSTTGNKSHRKNTKSDPAVSKYSLSDEEEQCISNCKESDHDVHLTQQQGGGDVKGKITTKPRKSDEQRPKNDMDSEVANESKPASHVESVIVHNGYWTIETIAETEQASDKSLRTRSKKKRISRVSILDLS